MRIDNIALMKLWGNRLFKKIRIIGASKKLQFYRNIC